MSLETVLVVVALVAVGLAAVVGAVAARIALRRMSRGLQHAATRFDERGRTIPAAFAGAHVALENVNAHAERALWSLGKADERMDRMRVDLTAKRFASDSLRVRLLDGQLSLARLRELIRLLMRLDKIRREFI